MAYYFGNLNKLVGEQNKAQAPQGQSSVGSAPVQSGGSAANVERGSGTIQNAGAMLEANRGLNQTGIVNKISAPSMDSANKNIEQSGQDTQQFLSNNKVMPATTDFSKGNLENVTTIANKPLSGNPADYVSPYKTTANMNLQKNPNLTTKGGLGNLLGGQFGGQGYTAGEKGMDAALLGQSGGLGRLLGNQGAMNRKISEADKTGQFLRGQRASELQQNAQLTQNAAKAELENRPIREAKAASDKAANDAAIAKQIEDQKAIDQGLTKEKNITTTNIPLKANVGNAADQLSPEIVASINAGNTGRMRMKPAFTPTPLLEPIDSERIPAQGITPFNTKPSTLQKLINSRYEEEQRDR